MEIKTRNEPCELFQIIPRDKIDRLFETSETLSAECDYTFLGFEQVYKAVTLFVPKSKVIIDCGCGYAFQSWYFREYRKYIGIDNLTGSSDVLKTGNSEFYFMSIQDFIQNIFPGMGYDLEDVFAVCSYVPDENAREMVRDYFPYCIVYYPQNHDLLED